MTAGYTEAIDDIYGQVDIAWRNATTSVLGTVCEIRWSGLQPRDLPDRGAYWARANQQTVMERQISLGVVQQGNKRHYETNGVLLIFVYCPIADKTAVQKGRSIATSLKNHFRSLLTTNGVLFDKTWIEELQNDTNWITFKIVARYSYEEIG